MPGNIHNLSCIRSGSKLKWVCWLKVWPGSVRELITLWWRTWFSDNILLTGIIAVAMLLFLLLAAVLGLSVPSLLQSMDRDPVTGCGVLVTALTDSMGFVIFLGLVALML